MGERAAVEARGAVDEGKAEGGDDEHAEECHLEAGSEKLAGIEDEQAEGGGSEGVDHAAVAVEQAGAEEDGAH